MADGIFVMAGDAPTPVGAFPDAPAVAVLPARLLERLAPRVPEPDQQLSGFHRFTFNELEKTESWRRALLARLGTASLR